MDDLMTTIRQILADEGARALASAPHDASRQPSHYASRQPMTPPAAAGAANTSSATTSPDTPAVACRPARLRRAQTADPIQREHASSPQRWASARLARSAPDAAPRQVSSHDGSAHPSRETLASTRLPEVGDPWRADEVAPLAKPALLEAHPSLAANRRHADVALAVRRAHLAPSTPPAPMTRAAPRDDARFGGHGLSATAAPTLAEPAPASRAPNMAHASPSIERKPARRLPGFGDGEVDAATALAWADPPEPGPIPRATRTGFRAAVASAMRDAEQADSTMAAAPSRALAPAAPSQAVAPAGSKGSRALTVSAQEDAAGRWPSPTERLGARDGAGSTAVAPSPRISPHPDPAEDLVAHIIGPMVETWLGERLPMLVAAQVNLELARRGLSTA